MLVYFRAHLITNLRKNKTTLIEMENERTDAERKL